MKSYNIYHIIFFALCFILLFGCDKADLEPTFIIEKNKISSKSYYDFGNRIVTHKDHVIIGSHESIHIFRFDGQNIELIQSIEFSETSGIQSMIIQDSTLAFGLAQGYGAGTVFIYERIADFWECRQEIKIGRHEDNFGSDIDIYGDFMVIGASAKWGSLQTWTNEEEGRVYVFLKTDEGWVQEHEFLAEQSRSDDRFGENVAIYDDYIIAGSSSTMHIYKYDETWGLLRTEPIPIYAISRSDSSFILYTGNWELYSFTLDSDGGFNYHTITTDFREVDILKGSDRDIIELKDNLALVSMDEHVGCCYLLVFNNNQWTQQKTFYPNTGETYAFKGLAISDHYVILGGRNRNHRMYSYVYFRNY